MLRLSDDLDPRSLGVEPVYTRPRESHVSYIESPGPITLVLPGGERHDLDPHMLQVWQRGAQVANIAVFFPADTLDPAVGRALALAEEWGISPEPSRREFEKWLAQRRKYGTRPAPVANVSFAEITDTEQVWRHWSGVEIRPSFNANAPYYVKLGIAMGLNDADAPLRNSPTTQPSDDDASPE